MKTTFFAPLSPLPDAALSDEAYSNRHCTQTTPTEIHDLDLAGLFDFIVGKAKVGRKGDAGYIIAGACETTRKEGGPAPFVLIDYDDRPDGPDWALLDEYRGFAWTTASGHPHWRVLIPLLVPMAHGKLECPFPGGHIRNRTQPAFLPTHPTDAALIQWRVLEGAKSLDGEALGKPAGTFEVLEGSMLGALFSAAGLVEGEQAGALIVRCPWQHEHTGGRGGGTVVFHDDEPHTGIGKFHCGHGHCNGRGTAEAIEALRPLPAVAAELEHWPAPPLLGSYVRVDTPAPKPTPPPVAGIKAWGDILETPVPPLVWLNEGLRLAPGRPSFIVSAPNVGKSWSIQTMAVEMAAGLPVFGAFPGAAVPVMFVTQDSCHIATTERFQILQRALDVPKDIPLFWYTPRIQMLTRQGRDYVFDPKGLLELRREAEARGCKIVILDSLFALLEGIDPSSPDIGAAIRATNMPDMAFLWTHHTAKASGGYYGSQAIGGAMGVSWHVALAKEGDVDGPRLWTCKKRPERISSVSPAPFRTTWKDGQRIVWIPDDDPIQGERPEDRMMRAILFVMAHGGLSAKNRILEKVAGKATTKRAVWDDMIVRGIVDHVGSRFIVAPGVSVSEDRPDGIREEDE